jgi:hypothetical protein
LDSGGKVPVAQLPNSIMEYLGTWDASTNTPTLANGTGNAGDVYICSVAGTVNFGAGPITFAAGDWVVYSGSIWQKSINSNSVASVNGQTGAVVLYTDDISEDGSPTNLWFTNARARTAISLTTSGTSGAATYDNSTGVLNVPNYGGALSGYLPLTGGTLTGALNGTSSSMSSTSTATAFIPTGSTVPTNGMYLSAANTLNFATNSTKVVEISSSGRMSIGATSPTTDALTVHGAITTTNGGNITSSGMISSNSTISSGLNIIAASSITGSALVPSGTTAPTVGMYLVSGTSILNGVLGFSTNSTKRLEINNSTGDATFTNNISAANLSGTNTGDQTLSGLGGVPTTRTITINGTSFDLSANRTYSVGTIGGSGTSGYVSKFTGSTTIGNSLIYDSGSRAISIGNSSTNSWASPFYVIEGGTYGQFIGFQTNNPAFKLGTNSYFNGSNYIYTNTGYGVSILDIGSDATNAYLDFYGAPTGTAGNAATISKKFSIDNTGNAYFVESLGVGFTSGTINGRIDFRNAGNAIIVGKNTTGGTNTYSSIRLTTANSGGVGDSIGEIRGLSTNVNNRDIALTFLTSEGSAGQTEKMRITAGGNVGIGTTPSAWNSTSRALQLPTFVSLSTQHNGALNLMSCAYESSANAFTYGDTGVYPARLNMNPNDGSITFFGAGTGTAGNAITWVSRLTIASTGAATFSNTTSGNALRLSTSYASGRALNFGFSDGSVLPTAAFYIGNQTGVGVFIGDETTTNGLYVKSNGNVGIGVVPDGGNGILDTVGFAGTISASVKRVASFYSTSAENADRPGVILGYDTNGAGVIAARTQSAGQPLAFWTYNGSSWGERMRITSGGNLLVGVTDNAAGYRINAAVNGGSAYIGVSNQAGSVGDRYLRMGFGTGATVASIQGTRNSVADDVNLALQPDGADVYIGKNTADDTITGISLEPQDAEAYNFTQGASSGGWVIMCNRHVSDGDLITFRQANTTEGSISVSGTTVSYNGGHLARWSQTITNERVDNLYKGTVMSNLDKMAEWINPETKLPEDNEQLNCMKISDAEGDINVAGVFVNWDGETNDMNIAMTGDMIIRIAKDVVVERGQLLMSAGDGTAKPQGDDIIRDKTIAKVTSNHVTCVYEDGSYCVPCVLMAC